MKSLLSNFKKEDHDLKFKTFISSLFFYIIWLFILIVITYYMRSSFFLIESSPIHLPFISTQENHSLYPQRPSSFKMAVFLKKDQYELVMDSGEIFSFPDEMLSIEQFIEKKRKNHEFLSFLTLHLWPGQSRVQIWPDSQVRAEDIKKIIFMLTSKGYDDFDIAVGVQNAQPHH